MLEWKPGYATGVPALDAQHKALFDYINQLGKLLDENELQRPEVDKVLTFLGSYAKLHFSDEENCMARFNCPAYTKNKDDHALFLNIFEFYKGQGEAIYTSKGMLARLHESMVWWIVQHILKVDIQLRDSVK